MPANTKPIFSKQGEHANDGGTTMNQLITAAANDYTGANANNSIIFTAGADGSYIQRIRFKAGGTNVASVMRVYINNGSVPTTAANNNFHGEISLPATTATAVAATVEIDYPMAFALKAGFRLVVGLGTAVAAGWVASVVAGDY